MSSSKSPLRQSVVQTLFRWSLGFHALLLGVARRLPWNRHTPGAARPRTVLLTGTFFSENWIMNHLRPIALSNGTSHVRVVCLFPLPKTDKVTWIAPPKWLCKIIGGTPARLLVFTLVAIRHRPDVLGGFHILPNGLVVALLAKMLGVRSIYFCGGGPREVLGGGIMGNRALEGVHSTDSVAEERLIRTMNSIDVVVCMGNRTVDFYRGRGVTSQFEVIPGGIDARKFAAAPVPKEFDMIFVGRLAPVKRVDLYLDAAKVLVAHQPKLKAVVVGDGDLDAQLKDQARRLGITENVLFAGHQSDVPNWLRRSKVFVLTSDSEGLSLAMMEALTCGLPCVVSDVGELGEIIQNGVNGQLVVERTGAAFAQALLPLVTDEAAWARLAASATAAARSFELGETVKKWDRIFARL